MGVHTYENSVQDGSLEFGISGSETPKTMEPLYSLNI